MRQITALDHLPTATPAVSSSSSSSVRFSPPASPTPRARADARPTGSPCRPSRHRPAVPAARRRHALQSSPCLRHKPRARFHRAAWHAGRMPTHTAENWGSDAGHQIPTHHPDAVIGALAACQHGVVVIRQLMAAGASTSMSDPSPSPQRLSPYGSTAASTASGTKRLRSGGHWLAAVLAVGPGAMLSHRHAAALHVDPVGGESDRRLGSRLTGGAARADPRLSGCARPPRRDYQRLRAIPTTTVARTLRGSCRRSAPQQLERCLGVRALARPTSPASRPRSLAREDRRDAGHAALTGSAR